MTTGDTYLTDVATDILIFINLIYIKLSEPLVALGLLGNFMISYANRNDLLKNRLQFFVVVVVLSSTPNSIKRDNTINL